MARKLIVVPMGNVPKVLLEASASGPVQLFQLELAFGPLLAEPSYAFNPIRSQYHGAAIVRKLVKIARESERDVIMGIGPMDLFDPDGDHLFVEADRENCTCVVGTHRLGGAGDARLMARSAHAAVVAVGRALGLRECDDQRCAMASINSAGSLDKRSGRLCLNCDTALAKGDRAWAKS